MRDHRQGNDLKVIWSILNNGKPFSLSGKELKLYLKNMYERKEVEDFSARGNQIQWTFYGKDQKQTGKYSLILVGNEGEVGMITIDTCDFVNIVSCSCKVKNSEDLPNVEIETLELTSDIDYVAGSGGGGSTPDLSNYPTREEVAETYLPIGDFYDAMEGYATTESLEDYLTKEEAGEAYQQKGDYATKTYVGAS